jgi:transposase
MPEFVRNLGPQEAEGIRKLLRSRTVPAGVYTRALIVHWSSQGQTPGEIAARLEHKFDNVVKWIRRFNAEGLAGLQERPGRGRKRRLQETDALPVVEAALASPR